MMKKIWTLLLAVCMVTVMMPAMAFADGGASPETHTVNFGTGSWTVGNVTVLADKSGETSLTMNDVITLTGFDASTMKAQLVASDGFTIELTVTEGRTSLSAKIGDGVLPDGALTFSVAAKGNNNQHSASAGKLTFTCQSNAITGGSIYYELNNSDSFSKVSEDIKNNYEPVSIGENTSITIRLIVNDGYNLDNVRGVTLKVNGTEKSKITGDDTAAFTSDLGYTINLSELVGNEGSISNSSFELEFGFGREAEQPPQPSVDTDNIYFDVDGTDGSIYYQLADSKDNLNPEGWISVGIDSENSNQYTPVAKSTFQNSTGKVFFRIEGGESKHLDVDNNFQIKKDGQCIYNVFGTYNGDPNYEGPVQPADKTGLKDMYDNMDDCYIIPVDTSYLTGEGARSIEFRWIDMIPISVEVDAASQYLIASGKTTIGIATGQGFGVSVQNGSNVSIPLLEDSNQNGEIEPNQDGNNESISLLEDSNQDGEGDPSQDSDGDKYLIDLNVNRDYFIPELSINDNSYKTYDTGSGNNDFTNIAVAIPAEDFKAMINSSKETNDGKGKITIHLTVDKNVPVNQGDSQDVQASFNMINDGKILDAADLGDAETQKAMETLDSNVALSASEDNEITGDEVRAFDITMSVGEKQETAFLVPIDISIAGDFDGDENSYKVIREHEGEASTELDCTVEKGGDDEKDVLTFSTDKFSKFTIMYSSSSGGSSDGGGGSLGGGSSGGGAPARPEPADSTITNSDSEASGVASTTLDLNISAKHEEGRTTAAVDPALGDRLVENAVKNNSTSIVLDLTGLGNDGSSSSEISFSPATFYGIASKTSASVTFQTASAEVMFDRKSVAAVSSQAGTTGDVQFVVNTTANNNNKFAIDLNLKTSKGPITNFNGGNVTVTVPVNDALASKKLTCVHIDDNGKFTKMGGVLLPGKKLFKFNTTHFSTYAILEEAEADAIIAKQNIKVGTAGVKLYTAKGGKLRVKASAKNATGYKVYYKKSSWKNYKTYTKGKIKTLDKTFKKLSKGKYTVKVKAYYKDYDGTGDVTWGKLSSAKKITVRR